MKLTISQLRELIKEEAKKLHRITILKEEKNKIKKEIEVLEEKVNPWAVCHSSVGPKKDAKFERCVMAVKKKEGMDEAALEETAPSVGLTKKEKSDVVKKAKAGKDIGHKGKGFKDVEAKAKASGATDPKAVAAAAMWKNIPR